MLKSNSGAGDLSTLDNSIQSLTQFLHSYNLMKKAIACRSIFTTAISKRLWLTFDPAKFEDSELFT